ncbi:hypothetical protein H6P81_015726 [Aristolochia fimbriata]|uniref:Uncharacterized protein n=1 Tax=Aristolochia fimbriata TaxID=158543 RepID=A0AAV7E987_ARIFI|nr:hypothetical protein H6P81_015726 [Aristolochia fimbriata]
MANPGDGTVFLNRTTRATRGKRNRARIEERRRRRRRRVVAALFRPSLLEIAQHIPSRVAGDASMGAVPWLPRTSPLKGSSIDINLVEIVGVGLLCIQGPEQGMLLCIVSSIAEI